MMDLQKLLEKIKEVEMDIRILESLKSGFGEKDENERCAGISYRGSWTVYFKACEVESCYNSAMMVCMFSSVAYRKRRRQQRSLLKDGSIAQEVNLNESQRTPVLL